MIAALALKLLPLRRFLSAIPRPVWIALAAVAVFGVAYAYHRNAVNDARKAGYAQGVRDESARIAKKAAALKREVDSLSMRIAAKLRERNDETNRAIARDADDLRLRGPGKAACPRVALVPGGSGRSVAAGGRADGAPAQVPIGDGFAAVPWGWLVDRAETSDLNRAEVLAWREWHRQQSEAWAKLK